MCLNDVGTKLSSFMYRPEKVFFLYIEVDILPSSYILHQCKTQQLVPSFCKIKPANKHGLSQKELLSLQNKILTLEIGVKNMTKSQLGKTYKHLLTSVMIQLSFINYILVLQLLRSSAATQMRTVKIRHASKLSVLNRDVKFYVSFLDTDKIVVNLSSVSLSDTEVHLSRG